MMSMDTEGFFLTIAQVGVALAGFAALVAAFRRSDIPLSESEKTGRSTILEMGLASTFYALIPFAIEKLLDLFGIVGVWRVSSLILIIFLVIWGIGNFMRLRRANASHDESSGIRIDPPFQIALIPVSILLIANILVYGSVAFYMIGLLWMLFLSGLQFMIFIYQYAKQA